VTTRIIVVENPADWRFPGLEVPVVHVDDYLIGEEYFRQRHVQVINLCRSYKYLSIGYYCSLLAEARRHRVIPSVRTMHDLSRKSLYSVDAEDLHEQVQKGLRRQSGGAPLERFEMEVFFGRCRHGSLGKLARHIFEVFPCPLIRVGFERQGHWRVSSIRALPLHRLDAAGREHFVDAFTHYWQRRWQASKGKRPARYDMAVLVDPDDPLPPSDARALRQIVKAGREQGINVELIGKRDFARLAEYDALFIRDTTRIDHYTYRFAKRAESEGLVVIDDPQSILRCANKVYLAELLRANKVPTPRTAIVGRGDLDAAEAVIGFPMVLKVPDGSFSQGVFRVEDRAGLEAMTAKLFKSSELILAQEYLYTEYDWRIGVLNRRPLFASQYFMSKKHWQIVKYDGRGGFEEGAFRTWPVEEAPRAVVETALKAANLIGDGLYGVDVKSRGHKVYVIEVNDNPNLEAGVEDAFLKEELYRRLMAEFVRRLERRRER